MTRTDGAIPLPACAACNRCGHSQDDHVLVLIREHPFPMGLMYCPHPAGCACGSTWRLADHRSTPAEVEETRRLVREALIEDGLPIPHWLR